VSHMACTDEKQSFLWPMGMMTRFINCSNVIKHILGWGKTPRIAVIAGEFDRLVDPSIARRTADDYRTSFATTASVTSGADLEKIAELGNGESVGLGVRSYVVQGAGHHFQNDLQWKDGASKLLDFYSDL
jgi:hypothetical protein